MAFADLIYAATLTITTLFSAVVLLRQFARRDLVRRHTTRVHVAEAPLRCRNEGVALGRKRRDQIDRASSRSRRSGSIHHRGGSPHPTPGA